MKEIRIASINDIDNIHKLLSQVGGLHHNGRPDLFKGNATKYSNDELLSIILDDTTPIFVCAENDTLLGYAFCIHRQYIDNNILTDNKTLYIDDLCVDETARGNGVGTALYNYVLDYAKKQGCYNVTLNVWAFNKQAVAFYQKIGMSIQKIGMEKIL